MDIFLVAIKKKYGINVKELELMDNRLVKAMQSEFVFMFKFSILLTCFPFFTLFSKNMYCMTV